MEVRGGVLCVGGGGGGGVGGRKEGRRKKEGIEGRVGMGQKRGGETEDVEMTSAWR